MRPELDVKAFNSALIESKYAEDWEYYYVRNLNSADEFIGKKNTDKLMNDELTLLGLISIIRNALAHMSFEGFGRSDISYIEYLWFASYFKVDEIRNGYNFVIVTIEAFESFLENWFNLLSEVVYNEGIIIKKN